MFIPKRFKILKLLFIVVLLSTIQYGCSVSEEKKTIFDNNDKIVQEGDSFYFLNRVGETNEKYTDIEYSKFYGVQTIWVIQSEKQSEILLNVNSKVKNGGFKVVLVTPEQEGINIVEQNNKGTYKINVPEGKYSIKIVGKNAYGRIRVDLEAAVGDRILVQDEKLLKPQ